MAWALVHDVHGKHVSGAIDTSAMTQILSRSTDGILWTVTASTRATTRTFQPKFFMFESVSHPRCFMYPKMSQKSVGWSHRKFFQETMGISYVFQPTKWGFLVVSPPNLRTTVPNKHDILSAASPNPGAEGERHALVDDILTCVDSAEMH